MKSLGVGLASSVASDSDMLFFATVLLPCGNKALRDCRVISSIASSAFGAMVDFPRPRHAGTLGWPDLESPNAV